MLFRGDTPIQRGTNTHMWNTCSFQQSLIYQICHSSLSMQAKCTFCYGCPLSLPLSPSLMPSLYALTHSLSPCLFPCRLCNLIIIWTLAGKYYKMTYVAGQLVRECGVVTVCRGLSLLTSTGETGLSPTGTLKKKLRSLSCPIARRSGGIPPHHQHHSSSS